MIQVKGCPLQFIMLMIKIQLGGHKFVEGHFNLMLMSFQKGKLKIEIGISHVYGLPNMIG